MLSTGEIKLKMSARSYCFVCSIEESTHALEGYDLLAPCKAKQS